MLNIKHETFEVEIEVDVDVDVDQLISWSHFRSLKAN